MSDNDYQVLGDFLHQFPRGFLKTESGVEIKILKKLFTEEEARLAVGLSPLPEELEKIADRLNLKADDLRKRLDAMAEKGLVFHFRRQGTPFYRAAPFMIGLYEYSVKRIDKELPPRVRRPLWSNRKTHEYKKRIGRGQVFCFGILD